MSKLPFVLAFVAAAGLTAAAQRGNPVPPATERDFVMKDFKFTDGSTLPELKIHYATMGAPRKEADGKVHNAVLVLHGTTGAGTGFLNASFAGELFGPGKMLDAATHFIVFPDAIGT